MIVKSNDLSGSSKMFYKTAKKQNQCCSFSASRGSGRGVGGQLDRRGRRLRHAVLRSCAPRRAGLAQADYTHWMSCMRAAIRIAGRRVTPKDVETVSGDPGVRIQSGMEL